MTTNLGRVFASVAMRSVENTHQHIIDVVALTICEKAIIAHLRRKVGMLTGFAGNNEFLSNGDCLRTTKTNYADGTSGWGGKGSYGIGFYLHLFSIFYCKSNDFLALVQNN